MPFAEPGYVLGHDEYTSSTIQLHRLGTRAVTRDGRVFRYAQAGATPLVAGSLAQAPAPEPAHLANTPPVVPVGATSFLYAPGAVAGAANLYGEGYLQVDTAPGNGYLYPVSGHKAFLASTAFMLNLETPIVVALTATSRVGLRANPYKNVVTSVAPLTAHAVGVAPMPIPAGQYGWLQTYGLSSVLIVGTPAVNAPVLSSATVAGAVDVWTAGAQPTANGPLGFMAQVGVGGKNNFVFLTIAA